MEITDAGNETHTESKFISGDSCGRKELFISSTRKLKNIAADWHNLILKWERLNDSGFSTASQIVNRVLYKRTEKESGNKLECHNSSVFEASLNKLGPDAELEDGCTELLAVLEKLTHLASKMEKLSCYAKGICSLHAFQQELSGSHSPLFETWPVTQFDEISSKLLGSYTQELALKKTIVEELAHTSDPDAALVLLSSWLYQPYLEDNTKLLLESLLLETGHRMPT